MQVNLCELPLEEMYKSKLESHGEEALRRK